MNKETKESWWEERRKIQSGEGKKSPKTFEEQTLTPVQSSTRFHLPVTGAEKAKLVQIDLEVIPAEQVPETLRYNTNVARMKIGGKEFCVVAGKTVLHEVE